MRNRIRRHGYPRFSQYKLSNQIPSVPEKKLLSGKPVMNKAEKVSYGIGR